jgi:demethylmenaquinone methyltransferase/2-methoxy-6-polyprenyl-1,4-benzoquinol methylase
VYYLYLRLVLPPLARVTTGNKEAYDYLVKSIAQFPDKKAFAEELRVVGFEHVQSRSLTAGIVAIHFAKKKKKA